MNLSLKRLLQLGFGAAIALTVIVSLITVIELNSLRNVEARVLNVRFPAVLASERIGEGVVEASFAYRNYMIYGEDPVLAKKYDLARVAGFKKSFDQVEILKNLGQETELSQTIENDIRDGNVRIQDETRFDVIGKGPEARQRAMERMKGGSALVAKTSGDCLELGKRVRTALEQDQKEMAATEQFTTRMTIFCAVLCVVLGIAIATIIIRKLTLGIGRIMERTRSIADGDLKAPARCEHSADEIGEALTSLEEMRGMLAKTIAGVVNTLDYMGTASEELSATAATIAKSAADQSSQTEQVSTAMHEMSATVSEVSENSRTASSKAEAAGDSAREGGKIVEGMVDVITTLADSTKATALKVEQLGASSNEIGKIIGVIDDIADQTNLLALNAAIEAARAGEQGRGFAVVADEVRKLAERTTSATREVGDMIKTIQDETRNAVEAMHAGTDKVDEGVQRSQKAGESLAGIIESASAVQQMITQIATAAAEQAVTTEHVKQNLEQIASTTHESATGAAESAKACDHLTELARRLQGIVKHFQVDETVAGTHPQSLMGSPEVFRPELSRQAALRSGFMQYEGEESARQWADRVQ
jgi:methyl-accepting chemotaxis protein